jgi:hypothetical protein
MRFYLIFKIFVCIVFAFSIQGCNKKLEDFKVSKIGNKTMSAEQIVDEFNKSYLKNDSKNFNKFDENNIQKVGGYMVAKKYFVEMFDDTKDVKAGNEFCKIIVPCKVGQLRFVGYDRGQFISVVHLEKGESDEE